MNEKFLLADDHSMIRIGTKLILETRFQISDIDEVGSCDSLLKALINKIYTHLILDLTLSDGSSLDILPLITSTYKDLEIMIFTMQSVEIYEELFNNMGIFHIGSKGSTEPENAILLKQFISGEIPTHVNSHRLNFENPFMNLTPLEIKVLPHILKGLGTNEIAGLLDLKKTTISTVKSNIFAKISVTNTVELTEAAKLYRVV